MKTSLVSDSAKELYVFDYLDDNDLYDLEKYAAKLNSLMLGVSSDEVSKENVKQIYTYLEKIASVIATYNEIYKISKAFSMLSHEVENNVDKFITKSKDLAPVCRAFAVDMSMWIEQSFHLGAPSMDFMNDTLVIDCKSISSMLNMDKSSDISFDDLDDIFDF
jgi:hypothetical protein